jgi:ketosteroid isomerase-like protein
VDAVRSIRLVLNCVGILLSLAMLAAPIEHGVHMRDREEVDRVIRDSIGWALTKDRARLESVLSNGADLFIFNPTSNATVVGWEAFLPAFEFWMDPRFKATSFDVRDLRISFSSAGDAAWFSAILDDRAEWDGRPVAWENTRWTGVLERREAGWVIVQMHFSFGSDEIAGGEQDARDGGERRESSESTDATRG